jgi:undecaprenyl diphosphate synthase
VPERHLLSAGVPAVDLVVRTGGQRRLSGFLPLQTAYAELWFTDALWSELTREAFHGALAWYAGQERRLGE